MLLMHLNLVWGGAAGLGPPGKCEPFSHPFLCPSFGLSAFTQNQLVVSQGCVSVELGCFWAHNEADFEILMILRQVQETETEPAPHPELCSYPALTLSNLLSFVSLELNFSSPLLQCFEQHHVYSLAYSSCSWGVFAVILQVKCREFPWEVCQRKTNSSPVKDTSIEHFISPF